jgi:hypothetical protein
MADKESSGGLKLAILAGLVAVLSYLGLEENGWIPHTSETVITAQANWINGESKDCASYPLDAKTAEHMSKEPGDAPTMIFCDDGPGHRIRVRFFGKLVQPDFASVEWRCTRKDEVFECQQTGGKIKPDSSDPTR